MRGKGNEGQRHALVTAASQGIGATCARELAGRSYRLTLMARSDAIHDIAGELGAIAVQGDVTKAEDLERVVETAMAEHGRIDAVVANTGLSRDRGKYKGLFFDRNDDSSITDYDDDYWYAMFDLLFMNVVRLARLITPIMQAQGGGAFVNISAMISKEPHASFPSSSTLRRGLDAYVKIYADRHARDGIRMNSVSPVWSATGHGHPCNSTPFPCTARWGRRNWRPSWHFSFRRNRATSPARTSWPMAALTVAVELESRCRDPRPLPPFRPTTTSPASPNGVSPPVRRLAGTAMR